MSWQKIAVLVMGLVAVALSVPLSASAASHRLSKTQTVKISVDRRNDHGSLEAWCPKGWHVTGGGFALAGGGGYSVDRLAPIVSAERTQGWQAILSVPASLRSLAPDRVYAVCVNFTKSP